MNLAVLTRRFANSKHPKASLANICAASFVAAKYYKRSLPQACNFVAVATPV
ncbi:hypothetical protein H6G06_10940 [Anabaena sphaerica FACHB-251]|uniref:Uncharacterized protein n=1 Tax=Anabaena sphaerica FACHB-251 TaxID=2692883 RepID=A0A926WH27_9NOST|nr:hypothetical protein [Anabaena sphaerica]MBD2293995.1 hypothetical protein [Anabaena sphaerica FACHB-251]